MVTPEHEYRAADAVRVECFAEIRAMLRDGSDASVGTPYETWAMRHLVAAETQVRALAEWERMEAWCANSSR